MPNQSCLIQIYTASEPKKSLFALVDHTSAFNRAVRELIRLSAIAPPLLGGHALLPTASIESTDEWRPPPLLGGHALLPTASIESTDEWRREWEIWMGALLRALDNAKEEGDRLEIPYDVVQAIATAEAAYTNLESQAEVDRARAMRGEMIMENVTTQPARGNMAGERASVREGEENPKWNKGSRVRMSVGIENSWT
ncbi:hypothetical protein BDN67DRAFT_980803 [Paxillus ammoniavirescens]|nr:hypothetical protein BDN67DRAFT_980803 [Paxillus ammoniavirescens]